MTFQETVGNQFGIDGAKILVWGAVGDKLQKLDKRRMMAIIQDDPSFFLSVLYNMEADTMIEKVLELSESFGEDEEIIDPELPMELEEMIYLMNKLDSIFFEATKFMHDSNDMLATGSFITGEFEQKKAILKTMGRVPHDSGTDGQNNRDGIKPKVNAVQLTS